MTITDDEFTTVLLIDVCGYSKRHVAQSLERAAKWFENNLGLWNRDGAYRTGKCCCLVDRFNTELHKPTAADRKAKTEVWRREIGIAHGMLAELAQRLYEANPDHAFASDLKYGRVSTINDYCLLDVAELATFIRELKGMV